MRIPPPTRPDTARDVAYNWPWGGFQASPGWLVARSGGDDADAPAKIAALEARDARQKTTIRELRRDLRYLREWYETTGIPQKGGMSFTTRNTIMKPLHSDHRQHLTRAELDAELDAAFRAMTAWESSLKRAARGLRVGSIPNFSRPMIPDRATATLKPQGFARPPGDRESKKHDLPYNLVLCFVAC
jgi:hypothetical protein